MRRSLPALALGLSLITACGGDGSPSPRGSSQTGSPQQGSSQEGATEDGTSKTEFIAQADAICDTLAEKIEAVPAPAGEGEAQQYLDSLLIIMTDTRDELAALDAPSDGAQLKADMVSAYETALTFMQEARDAAGTGDLAAMGEMLSETEAAVEQQEKDGKSVAERMEEYGFQSCGADL